MGMVGSRCFATTKAWLESAKSAPQLLLFQEPTLTSSRNTTDGSTQGKGVSEIPANIPPFGFWQGQKVRADLDYKTKEQHRLIYEHVSCALNHAKDLLTSFRAIEDTFIGTLTIGIEVSPTEH